MASSCLGAPPRKIGGHVVRLLTLCRRAEDKGWDHWLCLESPQRFNQRGKEGRQTGWEKDGQAGRQVVARSLVDERYSLVLVATAEVGGLIFVS